MAYDKANIALINPEIWYNLDTLAKIFDCKPSTLRHAINPKKELKARKRGRTWVVLGGDALRWWES